MEWMWIGGYIFSVAAAWGGGRYGVLLKEKSTKQTSLPRDYLIGINFLLNDETDKAVDIFIKMLEVDSDTVETHWAIGKLFRRRGEVDRAIRIHQNLIARPQLDKIYREQSLYELGQDYLSIGMLDRAERIFLELINAKSHAAEAWRALIDIYQQEKDWERAIYAATHYGLVTKQNVNFMLAHYYCELAEIAYLNGSIKQAKQHLAAASTTDCTCVRPNLLYAKMQIAREDYQTALTYLKAIREQNPGYFSEAIEWLALCYEKLDLSMDLVNYLKVSLQHYPCTAIVLALADCMRKWQGDHMAVDLVADYVRRYPSLKGLSLLVDLQMTRTESHRHQDLHLLQNLIKKLLADKPDYQCGSCGFSGKSLHWHCPGCKRWNTIKPVYDLAEI